jgi:hypothetical protein
VSFWYLGRTEEVTSSLKQVSWDGYHPLQSVPPPRGVDEQRALWSAHDWQRALILDASYNPLETLLTTCETSAGWRYFEADLTGYAGRNIVLYFEVINNGEGGHTTHLYVDDASLHTGQAPPLCLPLILS